MSKAKKGSAENPVELSDLKPPKDYKPSVKDRNFRIISAALKDDFCNYNYEITDGIGLGDIHKVNGRGIIWDEMTKAYAELNVHLAIMDEVFKHAGIEFSSIKEVKMHELSTDFRVTAIKIFGTKDDETIVLTGTKYVSSLAGHFNLDTPKVDMGKLSHYKWFAELKYASDKVRDMVALYKEGHYDEVEEAEEKENKKQTKLTFEQPADGGGDDQAIEELFENAKV